MKRSTFITWDQLKVGLMILVALGLIAVAVVKLGQTSGLFAKRYNLIAFLPSASGLVEGGGVTVAGQQAGVIEKIEFLPVDADTTRNLRIVIAVEEELRAQVRGDSKAKIRTLGLLGDKVFDIAPGTPRFPVLRDNDTISIAPFADYEAVLTQASGAVTDVVVLTRDLRKITSGVARGEGTVGQLLTNRELYDRFNTTLAGTSALMARLQNPNGTFGRLLDDPALYRNTTRMLASLDTLLVSVNSAEGTLGKLMRDDSLYTALVSTVTGANQMVRAMSQGEGTAARLINDLQLYDQLVKTVTDLNAILAEVRRDPSRYTKGMVKVF
ncbi:MAG: MlaD family protein [Gemmatimonadaceae bacterium]